MAADDDATEDGPADGVSGGDVGDRAGEVGDGVVAVGRIGRPRGVRGECFVEPWTDSVQERFAAGLVLRTDPAEHGPLTIEAANTATDKLSMRFVGIESREAVEALRGTRLLVAARERPELEDPDDFYDSDLIGLRAQATGGEPLGVVADVLHAAGADYLVLRGTGEDAREHLVPFVRAIVPVVDLALGHLEIDAPDGLFDV